MSRFDKYNDQVYYCHVCGTAETLQRRECHHCSCKEPYVKAKHNESYYMKKAYEKYGNEINGLLNWSEIVREEEVFNNGQYSEEARNKAEAYSDAVVNLACRTSGESKKPKCPECGSESITAGQRGYSIFTGFIGSSQTMNRCANCGHRWKPRK